MSAAKIFSTLIFSLVGLGCSGPSQAPTSCPASVSGSESTTPTALATPYAAALTGCTLIDYSVPVSVGSTSSTMSLIVDSGSTSLGVASSGCAGCSSLSPLYVASATEKRTCAIGEAFYGDGSGWTGPIVNDTVSIGGIPSVTDSFVQITTPSGSFFNDGDCAGGTGGTNSNQGIIGFAGSTIALPNTVSYLDALTSAQAFPQIFAIEMCMSGGMFWMGGYDSTYTASSPVYTPITQAKTYFTVNLEDVLVGGATIGGTSFPGGLVVDTGTSITYLPSAYFNSITTAIEANATFSSVFGSNFFDGNSCVNPGMTEAALDAALPNLTLSFQSTGGGTVSVVLPATRSYLDKHTIGGVIRYCAGIGPDGGFSPDIIGGTFLRSQVVIFDRTNAQVGFAPQLALGNAKGCVH